MRRRLASIAEDGGIPPSASDCKSQPTWRQSHPAGGEGLDATIVSFEGGGGDGSSSKSNAEPLVSREDRKLTRESMQTSSSSLAFEADADMKRYHSTPALPKSERGISTRAVAGTPISFIDIDPAKRLETARVQYGSAKPRRHAPLSARPEFRSRINLDYLGQQIFTLRHSTRQKRGGGKSTKRRPMSCVGRASISKFSEEEGRASHIFSSALFNSTGSSSEKPSSAAVSSSFGHHRFIEHPQDTDLRLHNTADMTTKSAVAAGPIREEKYMTSRQEQQQQQQLIQAPYPELHQQQQQAQIGPWVNQHDYKQHHEIHHFANNQANKGTVYYSHNTYPPHDDVKANTPIDHRQQPQQQQQHQHVGVIWTTAQSNQSSGGGEGTAVAHRDDVGYRPSAHYRNSGNADHSDEFLRQGQHQSFHQHHNPASGKELLAKPHRQSAAAKAKAVTTREHAAAAAAAVASTTVGGDYSDLSEEGSESEGGGLNSDPEDLIRSQVTHTPQISQRYTFIEYLGHGSYGHVYGAVDMETGERVAIKKITGVFDDVMHAKRLLRELRILRVLRHDHIIELRDILAPNDINNFNELYIVFEFADTDLQKLITSSQYFTNLHIQFFLQQILISLKYVHSANIIHRDLKPANILINANCSLLLCDFGLARGTNEATGRNVAPLRRGERAGPPAPRRMHSLRPHRQSSEGKAPPSSSSSSSASASASASSRKRKEAPLAAIRMPKGPFPTVANQLTKHVVTRWYRAPELILLESNYNCSIDIWSVGCVLSELLSMQRESFADPQDRQALFPGKSCFPLSADHPLAYTHPHDQLSVIFDVIGTPGRGDIQAVSSKKARRYLESLEKKPPKDFKGMFPGADPLALDLLKKMLRFNPHERITAREALNHEYLRDVRDAAAEMKSTRDPIFFEFEDAPITKSMIKDLIVKEVLFYNRELVERLETAKRDDMHSSSSPSMQYAKRVRR